MEITKLVAEAAIQIAKSPSEIFEAIADPSKMTNYFISESSGRLEPGKTITWKFPEFEFRFQVRTGEIILDEYISFFWDNDGKELKVEIMLSDLNDGSTLVKITEGSMENNEAGIKWLTGNTGGWANFLACLKAWLEYGINLRKGSFDYLKNSGISKEDENAG
jgi:uncharacterized protein YndB with AHSA1/START domain